MLKLQQRIAENANKWFGHTQRANKHLKLNLTEIFPERQLLGKEQGKETVLHL